MPFFTNWTTPFGPTNSVYIGNLKKSRSIDFHSYLRNLALSSRLDRSYNFIINQTCYSILIATALVVWWKDRKQYVFEKFAWSCTLLNLLQQPHNGSSCHTMCLISHSFVEKILRGQLFWHVPSMLSKIDNIISISCDLNFFFLHSLLLVLTSGLICYGYYLTWNLNSDTFFDKRNTLLKYGFWKKSLRKNATLNSWTLSSSEKGTCSNKS